MTIKPMRPLFPDYFRLHAKWRGDKPALLVDGQSLSWRDFNVRMNQVANALHADGVSRGKRAVIFMDNGRAMTELLFGLMKAGVASAPLNLSVSDAAIRAMIADCQADAIFVSAAHAARIDRLLTTMGREAPGLRICAGEAAGWTRYADWVKTGSTEEPTDRVQPDDILNIIYSSGTTGQPKGIVHTHQGRIDWAYDLASALRYNSQSRVMVTIGLYSNITWVGMLSSVLFGGSLLVADRFDADMCWTAIAKHGVTHFSMVPILFERLIDADPGPQVDTSAIGGMVSAGSPLRPDLRERIFSRFDCGITELYGLTEGVITTLDPEDATGRMASCGLPLPGSDLMILDETDQLCPSGQSGEILMTSRFLMPGYLNRDDATRDATYVDANGQHWLRTGDIGRLDADGYLYVVDRKKDMILSGGQNIYPQDIEAVLASHEGVSDVAVIGVPSRKWGETPLAIIASKGNGLDVKALREWANARLGKQQRIADVKLVDEVPRNPNGKVLKRELRAQFSGTEYD